MADIPVRDLLARASSRQSIVPGDGRSGAAFERVTVDGMAYFVKRLSPASDWVMRVSGDQVHRPYVVWRAGIMDRAPGCIDHAVVAMDLDGTGDHAVITMVMRDVGRFLVPPGDTVVPAGQHEAFIAHMAALAAVPEAVAAAAAGWAALADRSPPLWQLARLVHGRPEVISAPLARTPRTFLHGDWKMGNLGCHPDGRTILLDWTLPGAGPACWELCWYLALNRARLPEGKEATIARFRAALERHGIATDGWFDAQLDLCTIGAMVVFGWEKALGDEAELRWWERRVTEAAERQGIDVALPRA